MHKALWYSRWESPPDGSAIPCWLHSVHYHASFAMACIAYGDGAELKLKWVSMDEVKLVRRLPATLEEN